MASISSAGTPSSAPWPRSSRRPRRRRSTPTSRAGPSAAPPAARRCTTPPPPAAGPRSRRRDLLLDRAAVGREHRVAVASASISSTSALRPPRRLAASARITISSSPRRRQVVISSPSRPISALRDAQRLARSRTRGCRTGAPSSGGSAVASATTARNGSVSTAWRPALLQLARRARQHHHDLPVGRHDQPRRGPDRVERDRALGHHRLLAVGDLERLRVEVPAPREAGDDLADPPLERLVEPQRAPGEVGHHLRGEVVRGRPQAAARDDQVGALGAHELAAPRAGPRGRSPVIST